MLGPLRGYAAGQGPHRALKARTNCPVCSRDKVGGKKFHGRMIAQNSKVYTLLWTALFRYRPWLCACRRAGALPVGRLPVAAARLGLDVVHRAGPDDPQIRIKDRRKNPRGIGVAEITPVVMRFLFERVRRDL